MSELPNEVKFENHSGFWISTYDNVIMWVSPDSEEIKFHKVERLKKGYTLARLMDSPNFKIVMAANEEGEPIAFFMNPDDDVRYALMFNDPSRSEWGEIPVIQAQPVEGDEDSSP